jgi:hypothetical protein
MNTNNSLAWAKKSIGPLWVLSCQSLYDLSSKRLALPCSSYHHLLYHPFALAYRGHDIESRHAIEIRLLVMQPKTETKNVNSTTSKVRLSCQDSLQQIKQMYPLHLIQRNARGAHDFFLPTICLQLVSDLDCVRNFCSKRKIHTISFLVFIRVVMTLLGCVIYQT